MLVDFSKFYKVRISISSFFDKISNISVRRIIEKLKLYFLLISFSLFLISLISKNDILMILLIVFLWFFASLNSFSNHFDELKNILIEAFRETKNLSNKLFLFALGVFFILILGIPNIPEINGLGIENIIFLIGVSIIFSIIFVLIGIFLFHLSLGLMISLPAIFIFSILVLMINISRFFNLLDYKKYHNFCIIFIVIMGSLFAYNQFLTHQAG